MSKIGKEIIILKSRIVRYKRLLVTAVIFWAIFYLSGFLTGWWAIKGTMKIFPPPDAKTRLLVVAPHPDDEVLTAGGLIQNVLEKGGQVKIVFLTSGDGSAATVIQEEKTADLNPASFIALGEQRINEAIAAGKILGLKREALVFLGFPDKGLEKIYNRNFDEKSRVGASSTTKVSYVPYAEAFVPNQPYYGYNLLSDLILVFREFKPNMVVTTHPRDFHSDHRTAFSLVERVKNDLNGNWQIYSSIVHFRKYPNLGGYLFPPKKLFGGDWLSLNLADSVRSKKKEAIRAYKSQFEKPEDRFLLEGLTGKNEIFEAE